ncbi:ABC transporter permease [Pseudomonas sp. MH9.2]|uniref:ABC transporter permease n=2 Tax=Pseudomonas TaxID=286 RepID=UPI002B2280A0|nr:MULTISPECIES: ABC transporter permease [unclassified Pseudomonas]MEB0007938.1 ABC transporter permease [Pseudomonas sp. RTB2]MEB0015853.1 ABC transporter permease [Pseudomonas sp. RTB3]MEB0026222.1 ABC transporter permease [Pseudomonas sp. MH9.2]MEB0272072.1 ABC transporter permease [Pseudomonas sp. 5B4]MEE3506513.1 ABC transporter permease [Pseudomonas sp. 10C3]
MVSYFIRRLLAMIPVFFIVSGVVFLIVHLVPGDPVDNMMSVGASVTQRAEIIARYGLDRSLTEQYFTWLNNIVHGDLGMAIVMRRPVADLIMSNLGYSLALGGWALMFSAVAGVLAGTIAASFQNRWIDHSLMGVSLLGSTMPTFWLGLLMIMLFAVELGWVPVSGARHWTSLILPAITVGLSGMALVARVTRISMIEIAREDFVMLLHAKGLSRWTIQIRHILRHALIPVVTILSLRIGLIVGGSVTVEYVFARPGLGSLLIRALAQRDYPLIQGCLLFLAIAVMLGTLLGDLLQAAMDPRQREEAAQ